MDSLAGSAYFITLDLACGYWQVKLESYDKEKTSQCLLECTLRDIDLSFPYHHYHQYHTNSEDTCIFTVSMILMIMMITVLWYRKCSSTSVIIVLIMTSQ